MKKADSLAAAIKDGSWRAGVTTTATAPDIGRSLADDWWGRYCDAAGCGSGLCLRDSYRY